MAPTIETARASKALGPRTKHPFVGAGRLLLLPVATSRLAGLTWPQRTSLEPRDALALPGLRSSPEFVPKSLQSTVSEKEEFRPPKLLLFDSVCHLQLVPPRRTSSREPKTRTSTVLSSYLVGPATLKYHSSSDFRASPAHAHIRTLS